MDLITIYLCRYSRRNVIYIKRPDTIAIENVLLKSCFSPNNPRLAKDYGTSEVTIGFQRDSNGHEIVDFMSYDAKDNIFKCYEIKVTMSDFHSKAKKSWYGNYNYLAISENLYAQQSLDKWKSELPSNIGLIVIDPETGSKRSVIKAKRTEISADTADMLKNSLIRTLFYQNQKK